VRRREAAATRPALAVAMALLAAALVTVACTTEKTGAEYGEELFQTPDALSDSSMNPFSCADCHRTTAAPDADDDRIVPGAPLYGTVARERWWGGQALSLIDAVDTCIVYFMRGQELDATSDKGKALYEYLKSISPDGSPSDILPMTVVENVVAIPLGDATRGADLYRRACQYCHGEAHTGEGNILVRKVILPEVANDYDTLFPGVAHGLVATEVVRHGRFFDVGGTMPFFTTELLTDEQLGDILAFLGLPTS
jgi:thiosulfate dehydrogenase